MLTYHPSQFEFCISRNDIWSMRKVHWNWIDRGKFTPIRSQLIDKSFSLFRFLCFFSMRHSRRSHRHSANSNIQTEEWYPNRSGSSVSQSWVHIPGSRREHGSRDVHSEIISPSLCGVCGPALVNGSDVLRQCQNDMMWCFTFASMRRFRTPKSVIPFGYYTHGNNFAEYFISIFCVFHNYTKKEPLGVFWVAEHHRRLRRSLCHRISECYFVCFCCSIGITEWHAFVWFEFVGLESTNEEATGDKNATLPSTEDIDIGFYAYHISHRGALSSRLALACNENL